MFQRVLIILCLAVSLLPIRALAETTTVAAMQQEMIDDGAIWIRLKKTLFGRDKVYGYTDTHVRIVVIDPKSGRIVKDKTIPIPDPNDLNTPDGTGLSVSGATD
ncbi:hypothetical protein [uncultured Shimia sp.]|uniref:hypothetical protein n=1 Tax=uncultured Shimia sp. TaxID=573152 RepID=UPI002603D43C|nr:hypothetical protein [uncultured Shimia sp.]